MPGFGEQSQADNHRTYRYPWGRVGTPRRAALSTAERRAAAGEQSAVEAVAVVATAW